MANTYHQMYAQVIFAVKYRQAVLDKSWRRELFAVMGNLINETGAKNIIVNGVEDHVHCFFSFRPPQNISDIMQIVKGKSSKWLNERRLLQHRFEWQRGFGCFTYSQSAFNNVYRYIQNQEAHHQNKSFRKEYIDTLKAFQVDYDEQYLFDELI